MTSRLPKHIKQTIDTIANEFESSWDQNRIQQAGDFLDRVDHDYQDALLQELLHVDLELRKRNSLKVDSACYEHLGDLAQEIFGRFQQENNRVSDSTNEIDEHATRANVAIEQLPPSLQFAPPTTLGPYKLQRQIGEGGMGTVWMAKQERPVNRTVAIKLIRSGVNSKEVTSRFDAERQALAMMDHPNIATVLDAGSAENGRPYFVMELISGMPLNEYCDQNRLSIRERLELFIPVCDAVQHAHQKGIVHRDLKPSNVLVATVDSRPVPKVIDFGLAKALEHTTRLSDETLFTEFGQVVGTLKYMSPEQAESGGLDVDTRTDIYSLGVMLYELLAGSTPLDNETVGTKALLKILEFIRENDPPRPSKRLSSIEHDSVSTISSNRQIAPTRLQSILQGELDWVVMKALEKDRDRRYESAAGFAEEIKRFLNNEPVLARPQSTGYRLKKFVTKNKGVVAAVSLITLLSILSTLAFYRAETLRRSEANQRKIAEDSLARSDNVIDVVVQSFNSLNPEAGGNGNLSAADVLLASSRIVDESNLDAQTRAKLYSSLAPSFMGLGQFDQAAASALEQIRNYSDSIGPESLQTLTSRNDHCEALLRLGQFDEAIEESELIFSLAQKRFGANHEQSLRAKSHIAVANLGLGKLNDAKLLAKEVLELRMQHLGEQHLDTLYSKINLAAIHKRQKEFKTALKLEVEAATVFADEFGELHPDTLIAQNNIGATYIAMKQFSKAKSYFEEVLDKRLSKLGPNHPYIIKSQSNLAACLSKLGNHKASIDKYRETLGIVINNYGTQSTQFRNMSRNLSIALRNAGYSRWDLKLSEILVHELVKRYGATGKETVEELKKMRQKFLKTNRAKHARNIQEILDQIEDLKTEINELNLQL